MALSGQDIRDEHGMALEAIAQLGENPQPSGLAILMPTGTGRPCRPPTSPYAIRSRAFRASLFWSQLRWSREDYSGQLMVGDA